MNSKIKKGLGRGLSSLIGETKVESKTNKLPLSDISPNKFHLESAYPNPFNGQIAFDYNIPEKESVNFSVFDLTGRKIFERLILPSFGGKQRVFWNGSDEQGNQVSSGLYLFKFSLKDDITTGKITYLK